MNKKIIRLVQRNNPHNETTKSYQRQSYQLSFTSSLTISLKYSETKGYIKVTFRRLLLEDL